MALFKYSKLSFVFIKIFLTIYFFVFILNDRVRYTYFCKIKHHVLKLFKHRSCFEKVVSISSPQLNFLVESLNLMFEKTSAVS